MDPLMIGAGVGFLKGLTIDRNREKRDRKLAAETQRMSPWTGLRANAIREADPFGSALAFGLTGHQIGRGANSDALNRQMAEKYLATGQAPGMSAAAPMPMAAPMRAPSVGGGSPWWNQDPYGSMNYWGALNYGG
jgi:hypothetical protein